MQIDTGNTAITNPKTIAYIRLAFKVYKHIDQLFIQGKAFPFEFRHKLYDLCLLIISHYFKF